MELQYLLFDFSDEDSGAGSFDAMASVAPERVPALRAEVDAVLRWAQGAFGPPSAEGWDYQQDETRDAATGRVTLTLTIAGPQAFCEAFAQAFALDAP